ncbi:MAG: hypothetical protein E6552_06860, partial [Sutterella wadsworthensis]|nr:hypothetical protein [Sutterella wadsworthensis]
QHRLKSCCVMKLQALWIHRQQHRLLCDHTICFGHWSMLGLINRPNLVAIDTGCLWGGELTAVRFPDRRIFQEKCPCWANPLAFSKKHKKD